MGQVSYTASIEGATGRAYGPKPGENIPPYFRAIFWENQINDNDKYEWRATAAIATVPQEFPLSFKKLDPFDTSKLSEQQKALAPKNADVQDMPLSIKKMIKFAPNSTPWSDPTDELIYDTINANKYSDFISNYDLSNNITEQAKNVPATTETILYAEKFDPNEIKLITKNDLDAIPKDTDVALQIVVRYDYMDKETKSFTKDAILFVQTILYSLDEAGQKTIQVYVNDQVKNDTELNSKQRSLGNIVYDAYIKTGGETIKGDFYTAKGSLGLAYESEQFGFGLGIQGQYRFDSFTITKDFAEKSYNMNDQTKDSSYSIFFKAEYRPTSGLAAYVSGSYTPESVFAKNNVIADDTSVYTPFNTPTGIIGEAGLRFKTGDFFISPYAKYQKTSFSQPLPMNNIEASNWFFGIKISANPFGK